jgi:hypothetical protein
MATMFTSSDLAWMRSAQTGHMQDTCCRQVFSRTFTAGEEVPTYTDAAASTECGLDMRPGAERHGNQMTTLEYDATIRLPIATTIDPKDRIKITERFGETLATALVFEVVAPIQRGPSGIRLMVKRVDV